MVKSQNVLQVPPVNLPGVDGGKKTQCYRSLKNAQISEQITSENLSFLEVFRNENLYWVS